MSDQRKPELKFILKIYVNEKRIRTKPYILKMEGILKMKVLSVEKIRYSALRCY